MAAEQTEIENGSGIGIEIETENQNVIGFEIEIESPREGRRHWLLVTMSFLAIVVGQPAGNLLSRFYFAQGGHSHWLRSLLICIGWPLLLVPVFVNPQSISSLHTLLAPKYLLAFGVLGVVAAGMELLFSIGISFLPLSTFSLLCATPLAFNAVFAFVLVKQRISPYALNSIVLLIFSVILLGINSNEKIPGISRGHFILGFVCTVFASVIAGLFLPLTQLVFQKIGRKENFITVLISQAMIFSVATLVCTVGLFSSGDFLQLGSEYHQFRSGRVVYCITLICSAIAWQTFYLGIFGLIFLVSSLFSNVVSSVTLTIVPILAVIFFHEKLDGSKIMALLLALWGFISYAFGGYQDSKSAGAAS